MRILLVIIPFIFCTLHLNGQSQVMAHLFKDKSKDLSLYINPTFQFSEIVQQYCVIPGIRGGVIFNKNIAVGGLYNFTLNGLTLPQTKGAGQLQMKWGGIYFEYTLWPLQKVHLTIPVSSGIGQLKISGNTNETLTGKPNFFFAEPGLMIEINIWKYAKLGFGGSYRYTGNVSYNSLIPDDLSGFAFVASVKLGMFNYPELKKNKRDSIENEINSPRVKKRKSLQ